jgi:hypothetical protein
MMVMTMNDDFSEDINTASEADLAECYHKPEHAGR